MFVAVVQQVTDLINRKTFTPGSSLSTRAKSETVTTTCHVDMRQGARTIDYYQVKHAPAVLNKGPEPRRKQVKTQLYREQDLFEQERAEQVKRTAEQAKMKVW